MNDCVCSKKFEQALNVWSVGAQFPSLQQMFGTAGNYKSMFPHA
jgi:hypothetical protein